MKPTLDLIDRVLMLGKVDAFGQLSTEQLSLVSLIAEGEDHEAGAQIYIEGSPPGAMFLVTHGSVALERQGELIATVSAGEEFGTWALFDPQPRLTTARATTDVALLRIERRAFEDLVEDHPEVAHGIFRSLARRVRTLAKLIEAPNERTSRENWM